MKNERLKRRSDKHDLEKAVWWLNNPDTKWTEVRKRLELLFPGANFTIDSITRRATLKKAIRLVPRRLTEQLNRLRWIAGKTDIQGDKLRPISRRTPIVVPVFRHGEYVQESTVTPTLEYWVDRIAAILSDRKSRWRIRRCVISQCKKYFVMDRCRSQPPATCSKNCASTLAKEKRSERFRRVANADRKLAITKARQNPLNQFALIPRVR